MSEPLRQRSPPLSDEAYLAAIRKLPCCVCGRMDGQSDAAHIRMSDAEWGGLYNKPSTGMGQKPSDSWAVPLCRPVYTPDPVARILRGHPLKLVDIGCHGRQHGHDTHFLTSIDFHGKEDQGKRDSYENLFWRKIGKNPFQIASTLYAKFGTGLKPRAKKPRKPRTTIKPKGFPKVVRKIQSRSFPKVKRKM